MRLLLDMDCVLADFVEGAARVHGTTTAVLEEHWPPGEYGMEHVLAKALGWEPQTGPPDKPADAPTFQGKFWAPITATPGFWRNLSPLPWVDELVRFAKGLTDDLWIVTSPSRCPGCIREKEEWVEAHYGIPRSRVVPTWAKYLLAKPGVLLVDDYEHHVDRFREEGGAAVLFPALHNSGHPFRADPLAVVVPRVTRYFARKS